MGTSTNRNLQAKFEKSKRQVRELAWLEYSKAPYLAKHDTIEIPEGVKVRRIAQGVTSTGRGMSRLFREHF